MKEPVPLSRGNLVVHGDAPRRSVTDADRAVSPDVRASESSDGHDAAFHEDELPAPETTRNLLSMFRSLEDTSRSPPTPETSVKHQAASRSGVRRAPSMGTHHALLGKFQASQYRGGRPVANSIYILVDFCTVVIFALLFIS